MTRDFTYNVDPEFDYTIDEKGNTFIALRKIDWGGKGEYKLDIRKYYANESGETMAKGLSFLTEEGPNELTKVLLETGYGDTEEIANAIIDRRPEVLGRIYSALNESPELIERAQVAEELEENFYDPEELIG